MNYKFFSFLMFLVLAAIGLLQFFELPQMLNYVLLGIAIILGSISVYKKFKVN